MGRKAIVLAVLAVLACRCAVQADIVALKKSPGLTVGTRLDARFATPIAAGTINVVSGADVAGDVHFWSNTGWAAASCYANYGGSASTGEPFFLSKFKVQSLPNFIGARVNKAQLRFYHTGGNTGLGKTAYVTSFDWLEGTGTGTYPGAAGGASFAHPQGRNTSNNQNANGGTTAPLQSWLYDSYFALAKDVSATYVTVGAHNAGTDFAVYDVTSFVQLWANGTANYGFCTYDTSNNYSIQMSETAAGATYQPVLCIDYDQNGPPAGVTNLAVASVDWYKLTLQWTAPSDVPAGPVTRYEIRMAETPITDDATFAAGTVVAAPAPAAPGTVQTCTVTGLSPVATYYFAIKCYDIANLASPLSNNPVSGTTLPTDPNAPAQMNSLATTNIKPNYVTLTWTAVADDDANPASGLAAGYDLRYSTSPISSEADFAAATAATGLPAPAAAGATETFTVHGLTPSTTYYFAIKARDEVPNWSPLGTVLVFSTLEEDLTPPPAITDLAVMTAQYNAMYLNCTVPEDVGSAGLGGYDLRYSTSPIDEGNWAAATQVTGEPAPAASGSTQTFTVIGLTPSTTYYFAIKSFDQAEPANVSLLSNVVSGTTTPPIVPVTVQNPWLANDRVADTHNLARMGATYINAYTPDGVIPPANNDAKAINIYNNQKRRLYHWADEPPSLGGNSIDDPTYNQNVFGWSLCGRHSSQACTISNAAGLVPHRMGISNPWGHWTYQVEYDGGLHAFDTMCTAYVWNKATPAKIASCAQMGADSTLLLNSVADGRACPGLLLCGDSISEYQTAMGNASDSGAGSGVVTAKWTGNMGLRLYQSYKRTWEAWQNQHPTPSTNADSMAGNDPPYHHECQNDWKDTVNYLYWEPYGQTISYIHTGKATYRRWSNGTDTLAPDFKTPGYQSLLDSSSGIATYGDDRISPDLHTATPGTTAIAVFKITVPYYITDAALSGDFVRTNTGDVNKVYISSNGTSYTQVWNNTATGTTHLSNLSLRGNVLGLWQSYWLKVEIKGTSAKTDAGVSNLVLVTTFEHNKGAMAYLDKGLNNITLTFDNPAELQASRNVLHVAYKWKEYGGTGWTVDRQYDGYFSASPATFTINVGGTKVPRTESILMEVVEPIYDPTPPGQIADLEHGTPGSARVPLTWTATGDDGSTGAAMAYDLRYSTSPITDDSSFNAATPVAGVPSPQVAGTSESFTVMYLQGNTTYYFAIKAIDKGGNRGPLSNVISATTTTAASISTLDAGAPGSARVPLTWTAIDDGSLGTYASYDLRYSTTAIVDDASFNAATAVTGVPAPKAPGQAESFLVTYLDPATTYYFAIKAVDAGGHRSPLSNVITATTTAAVRITDLAGGPASFSKVTVTWTAIDDGSLGTYASYDLRYSTTPIIDEASFGAATAATGEPTPKAPGQAESFQLTGLLSTTRYYIAVKAIDAHGRSSLLSNVITALTTEADTVPPKWVANLKGAASKTAKGVDLTWTAPADYGANNSGPFMCISYSLRYSTSPILYNDGDATWNAATPVTGLPAPKAPGQAESLTVVLPASGTIYYFAIRSSDEGLPPNISEVSNCAAARSSVLGEKVLQNGLNSYTGCLDSYLLQNSTTAYGTNDRMVVCGYGDGNYQRGILKFDLASLAGVNVTSATLSLYSYYPAQTKGTTGFYGAYPVTSDWSDAQCHWTLAKTGVNWLTSGGDFDPTADGTSPKQGTAAMCWYPFDVTARVQSWLAGTSTNNGWIIRCTDETKSNQDYFYQSSFGTTTLRPKLVVSDLVAPLVGDVTGDGHVDVVDLLTLADSWAEVMGVDRAYDPCCDFNSDSTVDLIDLLTLAGNWGL